MHTQLNSLELEQSFNGPKLVNIFCLDATQHLLVCTRYAKENGDIYCDLSLYDIEGEFVKKIEIVNKIVRCIQTNSKFCLLTTEDNTSSTPNTKLCVFNSDLDLVSSISFDGQKPISCCIDDTTNTCFLLSLDSQLHSFDLRLEKLDQFACELNDARLINVKDRLLYAICDYKSEEKSLLKIVNLESKLVVKRVEINYGRISRFDVLDANRVLFVLPNSTLIMFDVAKEIAQEMRLNCGNDCFVESYCLNSNGGGYLACYRPYISLISIY